MDALLAWALENGPGFALAAFFLWLWNKEREARDQDRLARDTERREAAAALQASYEKRIEEGREFIRDQASTRVALDSLSTIIRDRRTAA